MAEPVRKMTAEERKELLARPLPQIRRLPPSYLWAGTITGDKFYGTDMVNKARSRRSGTEDNPSFDWDHIDYVKEEY